MNRMLVLFTLLVLAFLSLDAQAQGIARRGQRAAEALRRLGDTSTPAAKAIGDAVEDGGRKASVGDGADASPDELFQEYPERSGSLDDGIKAARRSGIRGSRVGRNAQENSDSQESDDSGPDGNGGADARNDREALPGQDVPRGGIVWTIASPVAFPALALLCGLLTTRFVQRTGIHRGRWLTLMFVSWVALVLLVQATAYVLSAMVAQISAPGNAADRLDAQEADRAIQLLATLFAMVFSAAFVLSVVSVFKGQAKDAPVALVGPRVLASIVCVFAGFAWYPATKFIRDAFDGEGLSIMDSLTVQLMLPVSAYVIVLGLMWGLCGVIGAGTKAVFSSARRTAVGVRCKPGSAKPPTQTLT